jgi:hypothetical protein
MALDTRRIAIALVVLAAFLVQTGSLAAEEKFTFVGSKKCSICHKKEADGNQYKIWQESAHAKAFETLGTPEAIEIAKKLGIKTAPQEAPECMKCHSTAWGMSAEALVASKITLEEGVSCESCHGPGSAYAPKKVMEGVAAGTVEAATVGLTIPTEAVCLVCHNKESPGFKGFDFEKMHAKIAHPKPEAAGSE